MNEKTSFPEKPVPGPAPGQRAERGHFDKTIDESTILHYLTIYVLCCDVSCRYSGKRIFMKSILIVEDNPIIARDISGILKKKGYAIRGTASSAHETMAILKGGAPDLILMDIILEGDKDGIELAVDISAQYDVPIIYLTAHSDEKTVERAKKTVPYGYVTKPISQQELLLTVEISLYKHQMEMNLKRSEMSLRESQEVARLGSYEIDIPSGTWRSSPILDTIFGIGPDYERNVEGWERLIHPEDRPMIMQYLQDLFVDAPLHKGDYRIIRANDGAVRWVAGMARLLRDTGGKPVGMHGIIQDITDRKAAEQELEKKNREIQSAMEDLAAANEELQSAMEEMEATNEELLATNEEFEASNEELIKTQNELFHSEQQYRTLFNEMLDGYALHEIILDERGKAVDYRFLDINPAFQRLTGIPRSVIGKRVLEVIPGLEKYWIDTYGEVAITGKPKVFTNYSKDLARWFDVTAFRPAENQFAAIFVDVTERKKGEIALKESEENLRRTFNAINDVILILDTGFNIVWSNLAAQERYGTTRNEKCYRLLKRRETPCTECITLDAFSDGKPHRAEETALLKDGTRVYHMVTSSPITASDGSINSVVNVYKDTTLRKLMEVRMGKLNILKEHLLEQGPLEDKLKKITDYIVEAFDADFARIWIIRPGDRCRYGCCHADAVSPADVCADTERCLHLMASSGRYTHTDGEVHRRIPFGCYKIGEIASGNERSFVTNDISADPRIHDHEWADSLCLTSFAGYRILSGTGQPMGVMALFSRHPVTGDDNIMLENIAGTAGQVIQTSEAQESISRSLKEKETLLQEIHHRVKNNLQVITSLLALQSSQIDDERICSIFNDCEARIRAMALIHEKLYHSEDLAHVNFKEYLNEFVDELFQSHADLDWAISYRIDVENLSLTIEKAIPCGLLANELISNAMKHAFPGRESGSFTIELKKNSNGSYTFTVADNGVGLPGNIEEKKKKSLGLQLVDALVRQIKGELSITSNQGTVISITFPE